MIKIHDWHIAISPKTIKLKYAVVSASFGLVIIAVVILQENGRRFIPAVAGKAILQYYTVFLPQGVPLLPKVWKPPCRQNQVYWKVSPKWKQLLPKPAAPHRPHAVESDLMVMLKPKNNGRKEKVFIIRWRKKWWKKLEIIPGVFLKFRNLFKMLQWTDDGGTAGCGGKIFGKISTPCAGAKGG